MAMAWGMGALPGWICGDILGSFVTAELWQYLRGTVDGMHAILRLPAQKRLTWRQRRNRMRLWWEERQLRQLCSSTSQVRNMSPSPLIAVILGNMLIAGLMFGFFSVIAGIERQIPFLGNALAMGTLWKSCQSLGTALGCASAANRRAQRKSRAL
jgi:hypothetical protein